MKGMRPAKVRSLRAELMRDGLSTFVMLMPYACLFTFFIALPTAIAIALSFTAFDLIQAPRFVGVSNYIMLLTQDSVFMKYILPNTLKFAILTGPGGYMLAFLLAWMLAQVQKLPRTIMALILYMPSMAGGVFISVVWKTIFSGDKRGYMNALLLETGLIEAPLQFLQDPKMLMPIMIIVTLWSSMGIGFLAMLAGILNVNAELYEAAYIDGLRNRFQEIIYVTIPSMKPQMLFGAIMAIVGAFNTGYIGTELAGSKPTPQYAGNLILNHIEDYGLVRYEMGYAAALSVALLAVVWLFSKLSYALFGEKD
jgi:multiple sugar transport system permease protein